MQPLIVVAQRNSARGDKYFNQNMFEPALKYYLLDSKGGGGKKRKVIEYAQLRVADCYRIMGQFDMAEGAYKKILKRKKKDPTSYLNYGLSLKSSSKYAEAKAMFTEYIALNPTDPRGKLYYSSCDSAQMWLDMSIGKEVKNVEKINTDHSEFAPTIYNNNLYFVSSRQGSKSALISFDGGADVHRTDIYHTNIFDLTNYSKKDVINFAQLNTPSHEGPICISAVGNEIYFTKTVKGDRNEKNNNIVNTLQVFYTKKDKFGYWEKPVSAFAFNSTDYSVGHPSLSLDENTIYFMSDMPGGFGKTDIYSSTKNEGGTWAKPQNLGNSINTFGFEMFPTISAQNKLYFSSDMHPGMGQLDVFYSVKQNQTWQVPVNAKPPINSIGNDFGIGFDGNNYRGFVASDRFNGRGAEDIYSFSDDIPQTITFINDSVIFEDKGMYDDIKYKLINDADSTEVELAAINGLYIIKPVPNKAYTLVAKKNGMVYNAIKLKSASQNNAISAQILTTIKPIFINAKSPINFQTPVNLNSSVCFFDSTNVITKIYSNAKATYNFTDTITLNHNYFVTTFANETPNADSLLIEINGVTLDNTNVVKNAIITVLENNNTIAIIKLNDTGFFDYKFNATKTSKYILKAVATGFDDKIVPLNFESDGNKINMAIDFSVK